MNGILANLYRNTATYGSPTWSAITLVGDLSVDLTWKEGDASTRQSRAELTVKTMLGLEVSGKLRADLTDANYLAMWLASANDNIIDFLCLSGPNNTNGVRGWRFDAQVFSAKQDQGLNVVIFDDFKIKPTLSVNLPYYVIVAGGVPTYTLPGS